MNRKKIAIVFITHHEDTLGNNNRLFQIEYLNKFFTIDIYTNVLSFVKDKFPDNQVYKVKIGRRNKFPIVEDLIFAYQASNEINKRNYDGVYMIFDQAIMSWFIKVPVFVYIHQYGIRRKKGVNSPRIILKDFFENLLNQIRIQSLKKANKIFVVSEPIIQFLKRKGIENLVFTPHGVLPEKFHNPRENDVHRKQIEYRKKGYKVLCFCGAVKETTGIHLMLEAVRRIFEVREDVMFVVAGAKEHYFDFINQFAQDHFLNERIINYGLIDSKDVPAIIKHSDICYSLWNPGIEGFHFAPPQKIVEYLSAGKPVICNKISTHELIVEDKVNGVVIDYDVNDLIDSSLELLTDQVMYKKYARNAIETSQKYDANDIYGMMVNEMNECI
ncbi:MAG: glycosyltransferase family 4 protein [bacterium]